MPEKNFALIETVAGKFVKVNPNVTRGTINIELSSGMLLLIHVHTKNIEFCAKDDNDIYDYLGDLSFESLEKDKANLRFFSPAIENVFIGKDKAPLSNQLAAITDLKITFSKKQSDKWHQKKGTTSF